MWEIFGAVIVGAVLLQLTLTLWSTIRGFAHQREQQRLALELWHERVAAAKVRKAEAEKVEEGWQGFRKFKIHKKVPEAKDIISFYLVPHDGKPLHEFKPGQFLTFRLKIPGQEKPTMRCYSLSDCFNNSYYRVSIKKAPGLSSCFFHDKLKVGDILDVRAPGGDFFLDLNKDKPVVLLGGGIGLTPVLAMVNAIVGKGKKLETWFFYGIKDGTEHAMKKHLEKIGLENPHIRMNICYSKPDPARDVKGRDYHHESRVSVDLLKKLLKTNQYDYHLCGPPAFMESLVGDLKKWGVPDADVHFEAFGPASVKKKEAPAAAAGGAAPTSNIKVTFAKSGKTVAWNPTAKCLLDFAEDNSVPADCGCRKGSCGTCAIAIKGGTTDYIKPPTFKCDPGTILTCLSVPKGDVAIDL
ncbi:MAG: 2Fe-2S iron-sulfur cluster binding domain-containing protein [Planctomycetes bacterium]|nr:2Fe-2S iron-sulfur cluster binding domain-containing protein [Planctomycetota bacterium]